MFIANECYVRFVLQNPNIRGSGYIEHPPQIPFAGKVVMQPSTVNLGEETPEWFAHGPVGPQKRTSHHHVGRNPHQHTALQPQVVAQGHLKPIQQSSMLAHGQQNLDPIVSLRQERATSRESTTISANADLPVEEKKLSKAAKAKLRKKMREGKV